MGAALAPLGRSMMAVPHASTTGRAHIPAMCSPAALRAHPLPAASSSRRRRRRQQQQQQRCAAAAGEGEETLADPAGAAAGPRADDVLPDSLTDALQAAAEATALAMDRGCERCIVEILLPEFW